MARRRGRPGKRPAKRRPRRNGTGARRDARTAEAGPAKRLGLAAAALVAALLVWVWATETSTAPNERPPLSIQAASYVDPAACTGCHIDIWETYRTTGMGRSFRRLGPDTTAADLQTRGRFYHPASDRHYIVEERGGRLFQRRYQRDPAGREENVLEKEIHFVMGSGNHARSFIHMAPSGKLVQLPLGWYSQDGGIWRMSPGYDRPNHDGFQRVISYDCMFCHNGYPGVPGGSDRPGRRPLFPGKIPDGIDCQRCHGPGSAHVEAATRAENNADAVASSITNPARLGGQRQREVCFQCHLETTSRPLPNIVHRYGRGYFSYRPGEPLLDYAIYFDHAPASGWEDKFEINHSAYRLMQSRCFTQAADAITCTTCHDPHKPSDTPEAAQRYDRECLKCHESRLASLGSGGAHPWRSDCADCHMPKRRTDDVVHAVMTDHRIQSKPPSGLLAPKRERSSLAETGYSGQVALYYPGALPDRRDELYVALAQTAQGSNLDAGIARLESAIVQHRPSEAGFYFELGAALEEKDRLREAARWFERAVSADPGFTLAWIRLGSALSRSGAHAEAVLALQQAAALDPLDARIPKEVGMDLARQGLYREAAEASRAAISLDPDLPELHNNLGGALAELGRVDEAESALREAVRLQPDLAEARFNLGAVLASRGATAGAVRQWREAVRSDPGYAMARYNLAVVLARGGNRDAALEHLDAALQAEPGFGRARALREELSARAR